MTDDAITAESTAISAKATTINAKATTITAEANQIAAKAMLINLEGVVQINGLLLVTGDIYGDGRIMDTGGNTPNHKH
ncbi:hypothetical protein D3C76_1739120 [compost metagenome]